MNKKVMIYGFFIMALLAVAGLVILKQTLSSSASNLNQPAFNVLNSITLAEVQNHSSKTDCWSIIHAQVYNLTLIAYSSSDESLLALCGKDGTASFDSVLSKDNSSLNLSLSALSYYKLGKLR